MDQELTTQLRALEPQPFDRSVFPWPPGEGFWVFAYGSLIWRPDIRFAQAAPAQTQGRRRRLCLLSLRYRGTPDQPGVVLGLDAGGSCRGVAYRIAPEDGEAALQALWTREMITGAYRAAMIPTVIDGVGPMRTLAFLVRRDHPQYCGRYDREAVLSLIRRGEGARGRCLDYVRQTVEHLAAAGAPDRHLAALLRDAEVQPPDRSR